MPILGEFVAAPVVPVFSSGPNYGAFDFRLQRPDGSTFPLSDSVGIDPQIGAQGLDGPAIDVQSHTPAGWDGELVDSIAAEPLEVFLPLLLRGNDLTSLTALKRSLLAYVNPLLGPVTIRVAMPDGTARLIDGYFRGQLSGTMDADTWGVRWQKVGLTIRCPGSFWRSEEDWQVTWPVTGDVASPLPILPLAPGSSAVLGGTNAVQVGGDVPTQPVWSITGPLESVTISDEGTGASFTFTASVADGDVWTIDTRRGRQGVFGPDGSRQRSTLNAGAQLFPLQPGLSRIVTSVSGGETGAQVFGTAPVLWLSV